MEREKLVEELARAVCRTDAETLAWGEGRDARIALQVDNDWMGWLDHAEAILSRLDALGLVVVEKEPTKEMILAGDDAKDECVDEDFSSNADGDREWYTTIRSDISSRVYAAMIAAATSSPQSQSNPSRS
jgi:hypothetical protein